MRPKQVQRPVAKAIGILSLIAGTLGWPDPSLAQKFTDVADLTPPVNVTQLVYAASRQRLIMRNSASAIAVVDPRDGSSAMHLATYRFTDMSLSPDGRYLFAADYGGENIGYGTPAMLSYVHRLDLADGSWVVQRAVIAYNVQAVSEDKFFLKSIDQWVTFTYDQLGTGTGIKQLNTGTNGSFPGYYPSVYEGDFRYHAPSGRLIHGNTGISSQELQAFKIVDNEFVKQEGSGTYGSTQGYGGSLALATDGSALYYGALSVDTLDVTRRRQVFPELIYAATGDIAFGANNYYNAHSGDQIDYFNFVTTIYALNPDGSDLWAYDPTANLLRHMVSDGVVTYDAGAPDSGVPDHGGQLGDASVPSVSADASVPSDAAVDHAEVDASTPVDAIDAAVDTGSSDASVPAATLDAGRADGGAIADAASADARVRSVGATDAAFVDDPPPVTDGGEELAPSHHAHEGCSAGSSSPAGGTRIFSLATMLLAALWRRRKARRQGSFTS